MSESVTSTAKLNYAQMRALLKTIADDDHASIIKLEIRKLQHGMYKVVARVERVESPDEKN